MLPLDLLQQPFNLESGPSLLAVPLPLLSQVILDTIFMVTIYRIIEFVKFLDNVLNILFSWRTWSARSCLRSIRFSCRRCRHALLNFKKRPKNFQKNCHFDLKILPRNKVPLVGTKILYYSLVSNQCR